MATKAHVQSEEFEAFPAKRFFVEMLTRDIALEDALLDLLDNSVDGIHRLTKGKKLNAKTPYAGYWAKIRFDGKVFSIEDNCGGISEKLAKEQAFMMGRPRTVADLSAPTVGMYGIGMKRSIFKIGRSTRVYSQTPTESFEVRITPTWLDNDKNWKLNLKRVPKERTSAGVLIEIKDLLPSIQKSFIDIDFRKNFENIVARHYAFILEKGFAVTINGVDISPKKLSLLFHEPQSADDKVLAPYLFQDEIDGVVVRLAVGFYAPMPTPTEIDDEQTARRSYHDAGWTIICNDRVVVYNDKSKLTGWGEADVPNFHNQFMGISGVVFFYTEQPWKLPLTTTKRGLESGSDLYLSVKNYMREGVKKFTSYTNVWKSDPEQEKTISSRAKSKSVTDLLSIKPTGPGWKAIRGTKHAFRYDVTLPKPQANTRKRVIHFSRSIEDVETVAEFLFEDKAIEPSAVGTECFERVLREAESS